MTQDGRMTEPDNNTEGSAGVLGRSADVRHVSLVILTLLAVLQAAGVLPADPALGLIGFVIAFALITAGLLASTFHLGHPERAWRALSQWRSSWLSREGLFAIATYAPAGLYAFGWIFTGWRDALFTLTGLAAAVLAMQTVYCTAMIYASLKTIRAWSNGGVPAAYFSLSIMTGALLLNALATAFGYFHPAFFFCFSCKWHSNFIHQFFN